MAEQDTLTQSIQLPSKISAPPALMGAERYQYASMAIFIKEHCVTNGVIFDIGCGNGLIGAKIAHVADSALIQADLFDNRDQDLKNSDVPFILLARDKPPQFDSRYHSTADTILLVNVLQHVIYPGLSPLDSKIKFLESLIPLLKPSGKILIDISHSSGNLLRTDDHLRELINQNETLKKTIIFSQ